MTEKSTLTVDRPLSPHLGIYRWQITMALSILHRITGFALAVGSLLLVAWLWATAYNADAFAWLHTFFTGIIGKILLIGWTYAFFFHLCNGVRHLFWDIGRGFEIHTATRTGWSVVVLSFLATAGFWTLFFINAGAPPQ